MTMTPHGEDCDSHLETTLEVLPNADEASLITDQANRKHLPLDPNPPPKYYIRPYPQGINHKSCFRDHLGASVSQSCYALGKRIPSWSFLTRSYSSLLQSLSTRRPWSWLQAAQWQLQRRPGSPPCPNNPAPHFEEHNSLAALARTEPHRSPWLVSSPQPRIMAVCDYNIRVLWEMLRSSKTGKWSKYWRFPHSQYAKYWNVLFCY